MSRLPDDQRRRERGEDTSRKIVERCVKPLDKMVRGNVNITAIFPASLAQSSIRKASFIFNARAITNANIRR